MIDTSSTENRGQDHGEKDEHGDLSVKVFAPREPDARLFHFPRPERVGDAARTVATAFGYQPGTPSFQDSGGTVLPRDVSLAAAHVHDGDTLELVDAGGGV